MSRPVDWGSATGATAGSSSARASYRSRSPASHPDRRSMGRSRRTLPSQAQNRRPRSLTGRTDRPLRCIHIACQHCQRSGARRVGADRVIRLNPGPQRGDLRETVGAECHCHGREEPARVMPRASALRHSSRALAICRLSSVVLTASVSPRPRCGASATSIRPHGCQPAL